MKNLIFLLLLIPSLSWGQDTMVARMNPYVLGAGTVGLTVMQSATTENADAYIGNSGGNYGVAYSFQASSAYTVHQITLKFKRTNALSGNLTAYLYASAEYSYATTLLATSTNTVDASTVSTSLTEYNFTFSGYSLTSGTCYWVALFTDTLDAGAGFITVSVDADTHIGTCTNVPAASASSTAAGSPTWGAGVNKAPYIKLWQ